MKNFVFTQQQYQQDATDAVVKCFAGQTKGRRKDIVGRKIVDDNLFGIKEVTEEIFSNKKLELTDGDILKNLREVQKEQGLRASKKLEGNDFSIEMETGTGKTYVYTKTMFELNKQYGWSKFIIMVPSVAIREGVNKSLEDTATHFQELYGKKIRFSIYNTKNKSNLVNIKSFANTSNIEVIIMNYQAFGRRSKDSLKIYQKLDVLQSEKPIDIIKRARPILIIDEPQRFGPNAEATLKEFDPLFKLRYSATHKKDKEFNKVYRLDAIDAYNQKLVKKINVKGIEVVGNAGTNSYLFLDRINISSKSYPTANIRIEIEVKQRTTIKKTIRNIKKGDDLFVVSNELQQYKGFVVSDVNGFTNKVTFINGVEIKVGQAIGDVDEHHVRRIQIRETIKSHLEKERTMFLKGIKVLSLFFIDEVKKYRKYDENGNKVKGEYEQLFEEEYKKAISQKSLLDEEYSKYLDKYQARQVHQGYFSIDKKGKFVDSKEKRGEGGSDDESAYELIMKNKKKLLDFSEPTRFIFSHSALREGWDNPNVFQICTLKQSQTEIGKRQEIGRGLRICVNKNLERMDYPTLEDEFFDFNTLTVVASESYDTFAKELQKEIFDSLSDRPIKLTVEALKDRVLKNKDGKEMVISEADAMNLIFKFKEKGYIDDDFVITEKMIEDIDADKIELTKEFSDFKVEVVEIMKKIDSTAKFKPATDVSAENIGPKDLEPNENFAKKEFQELWKKIKIKTTYDVDFDSEELIKKSVNAINTENGLNVKKVSIKITEGEQASEVNEKSLRYGDSMKGTKNRIEKAESILGNTKYDLIAEISKDASITRKTVVKILQEIKQDKFYQFKMNPEDFIRQVVNIINQEKATTLINHISYSKTDQVYSDDVFTLKNFKGSLRDNILEVKKHIYDYVKSDSKVERNFAQDLENGEVLVYAKLPSGRNGFHIPTPIGNYSPDWAVVFDTKDVKYVYFIAETKGSMESLDLKGTEKLKIAYAKKHFKALKDNTIKYDVVDSYEALMGKVMK
jgi:type III restriction enzyme